MIHQCKKCNQQRNHEILQQDFGFGFLNLKTRCLFCFSTTTTNYTITVVYQRVDPPTSHYAKIDIPNERGLSDDEQPNDNSGP